MLISIDPQGKSKRVTIDFFFLLYSIDLLLVSYEVVYFRNIPDYD